MKTEYITLSSQSHELGSIGLSIVLESMGIKSPSIPTNDELKTTIKIAYENFEFQQALRASMKLVELYTSRILPRQEFLQNVIVQLSSVIKNLEVKENIQDKGEFFEICTQILCLEEHIRNPLSEYDSRDLISVPQRFSTYGFSFNRYESFFNESNPSYRDDIERLRLFLRRGIIYKRNKQIKKAILDFKTVVEAPISPGLIGYFRFIDSCIQAYDKLGKADMSAQTTLGLYLYAEILLLKNNTYIELACLENDKNNYENLILKAIRYQALHEQVMSHFDFLHRQGFPLAPGIMQPLYIKWRPEQQGGPRIEHPEGGEYKLEDKTTHSNHHIIPIADLEYVWDYFYKLEDTVDQTLKKIAKLNTKKLSKRDENALNSNVKDYPIEDRKHIWTQGRDSVKQKLGRKTEEEYQKIYALELKSQYGEIHGLMAALCQPNNNEKTFFVWAWWNLFKGWKKTYRVDDPSDGVGVHCRDYSEKTKPKNFPPNIWICLKNTETGLYQCIQNLKRTKFPELKKAENELKNSLQALAYEWRKRGEKGQKIHPFIQSEWQKVGERDSHYIYRIKTS